MSTPTGLTQTQRMIYKVIADTVAGLTSDQVQARLKHQFAYDITDGALYNSLQTLVGKQVLVEEARRYCVPGRQTTIFEQQRAQAAQSYQNAMEEIAKYYPMVQRAFAKVSPLIEAVIAEQTPPGNDQAWRDWAYQSHQLNDAISKARSWHDRIGYYEELIAKAKAGVR